MEKWKHQTWVLELKYDEVKSNVMMGNMLLRRDVHKESVQQAKLEEKVLSARREIQASMEQHPTASSTEVNTATTAGFLSSENRKRNV